MYINVPSETTQSESASTCINGGMTIQTFEVGCDHNWKSHLDWVYVLNNISSFSSGWAGITWWPCPCDPRITSHPCSKWARASWLLDMTPQSMPLGGFPDGYGRDMAGLQRSCHRCEASPLTWWLILSNCTGGGFHWEASRKMTLSWWFTSSLRPCASCWRATMNMKMQLSWFLWVCCASWFQLFGSRWRFVCVFVIWFHLISLWLSPTSIVLDSPHLKGTMNFPSGGISPGRAVDSGNRSGEIGPATKKYICRAKMSQGHWLGGHCISMVASFLIHGGHMVAYVYPGITLPHWHGSEWIAVGCRSSSSGRSTLASNDLWLGAVPKAIGKHRACRLQWKGAWQVWRLPVAQVAVEKPLYFSEAPDASSNYMQLPHFETFWSVFSELLWPGWCWMTVSCGACSSAPCLKGRFLGTCWQFQPWFRYIDCR